jgi:hypothetical protein
MARKTATDEEKEKLKELFVLLFHPLSPRARWLCVRLAESKSAIHAVHSRSASVVLIAMNNA